MRSHHVSPRAINTLMMTVRSFAEDDDVVLFSNRNNLVMFLRNLHDVELNFLLKFVLRSREVSVWRLENVNLLQILAFLCISWDIQARSRFEEQNSDHILELWQRQKVLACK
jgi:hypothetical protein